MESPLVTIVCLCHNQGAYVKYAVDSILAQTYNNIEIILVDDASTDNSKEAIAEIIALQPNIKFINIKENQGNCKSFNMALNIAKGKYIIDHAADDVLMENCVSIGVAQLEEKGNDYGIHFSDAIYINEKGEEIGLHKTSSFFAEQEVPQGYLFAEVLAKYFICPPTMLYRKSMIDSVGGYDASLSYEDFDLWVRTSKFYKYCFSPKTLVKKRNVKSSASNKQYKWGSLYITSTLTVCKKAFLLCDNKSEYKALWQRLAYELKQSFKTGKILAIIGLVLLLLRASIRFTFS